MAASRRNVFIQRRICVFPLDVSPDGSLRRLGAGRIYAKFPTDGSLRRLGAGSAAHSAPICCYSKPSSVSLTQAAGRRRRPICFHKIVSVFFLDLLLFFSKSSAAGVHIAYRGREFLHFTAYDVTLTAPACFGETGCSCPIWVAGPGARATQAKAGADPGRWRFHTIIGRICKVPSATVSNCR